MKHSGRLMKIAQCLEYPLELRGGVSVVVENLAPELSRLGHQVVLVSRDNPEKIKSVKFITDHIHWDNPKCSVASARKMAVQLAATGIDVAHFHAGGNYGWNNRFPFHCPAYHLSRLGIPVVWTSHRAETILDGFCGPQRSLLYKLFLFPIAWLGKIQQLHRTRFEVAVSQDNLKKLRRWYPPARSRFVQIYHSRLDSTLSIPENTAQKTIILCVGHFAAVKGQTVLVDAFSRIAKHYPNFVLKLAGAEGWDGALDRVRRIIKEAKIEKQVVLLGEQTDTATLMREASIYVQPSLNEALGLALQEAMYYGCACIGSRVGGIPELIQHEQNGLLVERGNVAQLARVMEELVKNSDRREQLGRAAAASIRERKMTLQHMAESYLALYQAGPG